MPEVCLQQGGLLLRFSALYGGRVHRVNVDRPLEANLLAVRGVPVGDRQPPRAVAAVFEGEHLNHCPCSNPEDLRFRNDRVYHSAYRTVS